MNAIECASRFVTELDKVKEELAKVRDPDLGSTVLAVTVIHGGIKEKIIPERCDLTIDCRRIPMHSAESIRKAIETILGRLGIANAGFSTELRMTFKNDPLCLPQRHKFVRIVEVLGTKSVSAPYNTEAPLYNHIGIPTLVLGPGSIEQAHVANEFVQLIQLRRAETTYGNLIREVCT